ncbi:MAG TPA: hypothetical protein VIC62_06220, partial [Nakamurella sp.]
MLDDSALLALGRGYPALSGFIVDAAAGRAVLAVPALCICAAEAQRPGIADHIGALPVDIEPLEESTTVPVGRFGENIDWRIAQAVAAALPSVAFPQGGSSCPCKPLATGQPPSNRSTPARSTEPSLAVRDHGLIGPVGEAQDLVEIDALGHRDRVASRLPQPVHQRVEVPVTDL